jgi:hypothetical protein
MSIDAAQAAAGTTLERRVLRLGLGTALGFAIASALEWPAAVLTPILFIQLSVGLPRSPGLAMALKTIVAIAACVFVGWLITFAVAIPMLCVLLIALLLFVAFRAQASGRAGLAPFMLMISVSILPVLAIQAPELSTLVAIELVRATAVAFLLVWGTWSVFPDLPSPARAGDDGGVQLPQRPSRPVVGARERDRIALINTLVVMPVVLTFLLFDLDSGTVVLITTLSIVRTQSNAIRLGMTGSLLRGNIIAGCAAVLATAVIYAAPSLVMLFLVVLLIALLFGSYATAAPSGQAAGWITALISTMVLTDSALSVLSEGAGTAAWSRIVGLTAAILYVTAALRLTASLRRPRATVTQSC